MARIIQCCKDSIPRFLRSPLRCPSRRRFFPISIFCSLSHSLLQSTSHCLQSASCARSIRYPLPHSFRCFLLHSLSYPALHCLRSTRCAPSNASFGAPARTRSGHSYSHKISNAPSAASSSSQIRLYLRQSLVIFASVLKQVDVWFDNNSYVLVFEIKTLFR